MRQSFAVFDIAGDIAHYRRQYAITSALTYAIPPRTALCGLVGAILGLSKLDNAYLASLTDDQAVFGLQLLAPLRTGHVSLNLLDTKGSSTFQPKSVNPHTIMRYEVVREPRYRVYFGHPSLADKLVRIIRAGETHYTPCLGLAWMLAWFDGTCDSQHAELVEDDTVQRSFVSPIRADDLEGEILWDDKGVYQRLRMPAEMQQDRLVTRYEHYVIETTGLAIDTSLKRYWRLADGSCFSAL